MPPTADFQYFFIRLPWTALIFSKKTRPKKNIGKPCVFTCFLHYRVCARASNIDRKPHRMRFSSDSRHRGLSNDDFFGFRSAEMVSEASPGRLGRPPGAPLALSWPPTGPSWRALGPLLAASGPLLGALGSLLATLLHTNSRNFVYRTRFSLIWAPFGHEKLQKISRKPLKSMRKNEISAAPPTSDTNQGEAVARSELNPPHPTFTSGTKRSK